MTSNQIVAAVFTFVGMMASGDYREPARPVAGMPAIQESMQYVNFVNVWIESLFGTMAPRYLIFHASLTVFFPFATV